MNRSKNLRASLIPLVIFLVTGVLVGILTFRTVRDVVAGWNLTALEGIVVQGSSPTQPTTAPGEPSSNPFHQTELLRAGEHEQPGAPIPVDAGWAGRRTGRGRAELRR